MKGAGDAMLYAVIAVNAVVVLLILGIWGTQFSSEAKEVMVAGVIAGLIASYVLYAMGYMMHRKSARTR
jgi:hypothetical protein